MTSTDLRNLAHTRAPRLAGVAPAVGAAVLWGSTGTSQALAPPDASPLAVGSIRITIGAVGLLA